MGEKKHIDRLFQEKLKDYEVFPEAHVWKNIEQQLTKKKRRRIVPLWLRLGGAAAILLLLVNGGMWYFNQGVDSSSPAIKKNTPIFNDVNPNTQQIEVATEEQKELVEEPIDSKSTQDNSNIAPVNRSNSIIGTRSTPSNQEKSVALTETKQKQNDGIVETNNIITQSTPKTNLDKGIAKNLENEDMINSNENTAIVQNNEVQKEDLQLRKKDITDAIEENLKEETIADLGTNKKWSIGSTVAPVYFNSLSDGSPIDASLANSDKTANTSLSYGVKLNYAISDKLTLQTGVNSVELAYKTRGVTALIASSELQQLSNSNIDTNINGVNLIAISNNQLASQSAGLDSQRGFLNLRGDLNQSLSYIEIPTEIKYAFSDKKFGVHVVGGVSTYILYKNQVSLFNQNGKTTLGEASNINNVNFSGNLGLDLDYKINKKLFINVSPMFKYQVNTFSKDDGGFKPYYLGVYTGLNFRF